MLNDLFKRILRKLAFSAPGGYSLRPFLHKLRGVKIGEGVWISQYVYIDELHPESISIGNHSTIGIGSMIIAHLYWGPKQKNYQGKVIIEDDVFIGPNCIILPDVVVGQGAVVQAGTVVSRNVPAKTLWGAPKAGALARVTIPLTHHHSYEKFKNGLRPLMPGSIHK
ncbi:MAG TPA: DapH/DapD/GlmU-related protein [Chitinispirillaceae bacterium]|nr:DapH/DapD/GlmU-related protein [Chitinispirillaceae bacterium]